MTPEEAAVERTRRMEEAFARIEPKNEAEQSKLARMKEKMLAHSIESQGIVRQAMQDQELARIKSRESRTVIEATLALHKERQEAWEAAMQEQTELLDRIVPSTKRG